MFKAANAWAFDVPAWSETEARCNPPATRGPRSEFTNVVANQARTCVRRASEKRARDNLVPKQPPTLSNEMT